MAPSAGRASRLPGGAARSSAPPRRDSARTDDARRGVAIVSPDGRILSADPTLCRIAGRAAVALVGRDLATLLAPNGRASWRAALDAFAAGRRGAATIDTRLSASGPCLRRVRLTVSARRDEAGVLTALEASVEDMTAQSRGTPERQGAATRARGRGGGAAEAARLGAQIAAMPDLYLMLDADDAYTILGASDAYLHATMTRREEIVGRRLFEVFPDPPDEPGADGVRNLGASLARVRATARTDRMAVQRYPIRRPEAAGGGFEERYWEPLNVPVLGPDGTVDCIIHRVVDVTDRLVGDGALSRAEGLLRIAGRIARIGGWSVEIATGAVTWSDEVRAIHEVAPGTEITLEQAIAFHAPEYREQVRRAVEACATEGTPYDEEREIVTTTGSRRWVRAIGEAVRDLGGRIVRLHGAFQDITPLKRAEAERGALAQRLNASLESMSDAFFLVDRDWRFVFLNARAERVLRRSRAELIGRMMWDEFPQAIGTVAYREYHAALAEQQPRSFEYFYAPLEAWFDISAFPAEDGLAVYFRDITGKRAADEQLRLLEKAVSRLQDMVVITEVAPVNQPKRRIVFVNRAFEQRTGYAAAEVIGQTPRILYGPATDRATLAIIQAALAAGEPVHAELVNYTKAGTPFWMEMDLVPIADATGRLTHWVAVQRDITARRREETLRATETTVLGLVAAGAPLPEVLSVILHTVEELSTDAIASIVLLDEDGVHMRTGAAPSLPEAFSQALDGVKIGPRAGSCGTAMHWGTPVVTVDIETDPLWDEARPLARAHGLRACWSSPVKQADGRVLASFALYWREQRAPTGRDHALIARVSGLAAIAIARSRTLEALRASEQRFQAVASATADVVWDWDLKRNLIWWGEGFEHVFGHPRDRLYAGPDGRTNHVHPDDRARVIAGISAVIARREPFWHDEYRFIHSDGRLIHVEDRGRLILDDDGEPARFVGGMRDITERLESQAWIAELRQRLDTLVSQAKVGILVHHEFRPILANEELARMLGYRSSEEILALDDCLALFAESERARLTAYYNARLGGGDAPGFFAVKGRRRDGTERDLENRAFRIDWGGVRAVCAMLTDVTEQRAMEDRLLKSQRLEAMGQLTGGIAHDFNNLLTIILGNAEMLAESLPDTPPLRPLAEMTRSAAERGAELTSRLLAFARRQALDPKPIDVDALIAGMATMLRRTLGEHVEIALDPGERVPEALVDAGQLENAILNLCINARDAMPGGGRLTIETAHVHVEQGASDADGEVVPGPYVMVAVSDTGTGMAPEVLARVFDPFFTTKDVGKGSGLGLSMVYGFVKQSHGHVRIQSAPGRGTTVRLYLPRAPRRVRSADAEPDRGPAPRGRETILVVEDDTLVRQHVVSALETLGYRVLGAANGPEALEVLRTTDDLDLLFTDVVMPGGMNGRELADAARELRPNLPVLFTSGYTEDAIVHHGRLDPGVQLLRKPYRRQELAAKLRQVLNGRTD